MKIATIVGARPNFIKLAALHDAFTDFDHVIVHTGQHYDYSLSEGFFKDLSIPEPDYNLGVGSVSQSEQVSRTLSRLAPILADIMPDCVVVVGDTNATVAGSLAAKYLHFKLAHVEAGLRSRDREMPEEINRIVTDHLSDILFTTERDAGRNLRAEGIYSDKSYFVGNVMIDTLLKYLPMIEKPDIQQPYTVVTLHRPSNTDDDEILLGWLEALEQIAQHTTIVFPVHPRTRKRMDELGYTSRNPNIILCPPVGYLEMIGLLKYASVVLTDSGGIQEETSFLRVPCLTLRDSTERPITIYRGTNRLIGADPSRLYNYWMGASSVTFDPPMLEGWDGRAAERIARVLAEGIKT